MPLLTNSAGCYRFLPGGDPYSAGVVADPGYSIVRVTAAATLPWRAGMEAARAWLIERGRPGQALCGVELRCPAPYTRAGFLEFNRGYRSLLEEWGILVDGENPVARTNVAPVLHPPSEPVLHAFSAVVPSDRSAASFVVSGAGELRGGPILEAAVVRAGENSDEALGEKASYVLHVMAKRLAGLGVDWGDVTAVRAYHAESPNAVLPAIHASIGLAGRFGLTWHLSRPPIDELLVEMDCRGIREERTEDLGEFSSG